MLTPKVFELTFSRRAVWGKCISLGVFLIGCAGMSYSYLGPRPWLGDEGVGPGIEAGDVLGGDGEGDLEEQPPGVPEEEGPHRL